MAEDAESILARGGNLRLTPPIGRRVGMLAPLAISLIAIRMIDGGRAVTLWLVGLVLVGAIVALVSYSRMFLTVVGPVLRWRTAFRVHEVSLADVDMPIRHSDLGGGSLVVPTADRRIVLYARLWGTDALDSLESRLTYNARVARPRASAASA